MPYQGSNLGIQEYYIGGNAFTRNYCIQENYN